MEDEVKLSSSNDLLPEVNVGTKPGSNRLHPQLDPADHQ